MDMNLRELQEMVKGRETWSVAVHRVSKSQTQFSNWTTIYIIINNCDQVTSRAEHFGFATWYSGS